MADDFEQDRETEGQSFLDALFDAVEGVLIFEPVSPEQVAWEFMYPTISYVRRTDKRCDIEGCTCGGENFLVERVTYTADIN
jgi:hypothetical protein